MQVSRRQHHGTQHSCTFLENLLQLTTVVELVEAIQISVEACEDFPAELNGTSPHQA